MRDNLKQVLGEHTPMHEYTKKLAAADEEKLLMGNSNSFFIARSMTRISAGSLALCLTSEEAWLLGSVTYLQTF